MCVEYNYFIDDKIQREFKRGQNPPIWLVEIYGLNYPTKVFGDF